MEIGSNQSKDILFLYSISQELKNHAKTEDFSIHDYIAELEKSGDNVEVRELTKEALAYVEHYKIVVFLVSQDQDTDSFVLADGKSLPWKEFMATLPYHLDHEVMLDFIGYDDIYYGEIDKNYIIQTDKAESCLKPRLDAYIILASFLANYPTINYYQAYLFFVNLLEEGRSGEYAYTKLKLQTQKAIYRGLSYNTSTSYPSAAWSGLIQIWETAIYKKDIGGTIFAPEEVFRGDYFKIQIFLSYDSTIGTLKVKARGIDPKTTSRTDDICLMNIHKEDEITIKLSFKNGNRQPTTHISTEDLIDSKTVIIGKDRGTFRVEFNAKVHIDYRFNMFSTIIEFYKADNPLIEPFEFVTYVIKDLNRIEEPPHFPNPCNEKYGEKLFQVLKEHNFISDTEKDCWLYLMGFPSEQPTNLKPIKWMKNKETARYMLSEVFNHLTTTKEVTWKRIKELTSQCFINKKGEPLRLANKRDEASTDMDTLTFFFRPKTDLVSNS